LLVSEIKNVSTLNPVATINQKLKKSGHSLSKYEQFMLQAVRDKSFSIFVGNTMIKPTEKEVILIWPGIGFWPWAVHNQLIQINQKWENGITTASYDLKWILFTKKVEQIFAGAFGNPQWKTFVTNEEFKIVSFWIEKVATQGSKWIPFWGIKTKRNIDISLGLTIFNFNKFCLNIITPSRHYIYMDLYYFYKNESRVSSINCIT